MRNKFDKRGEKYKKGNAHDWDIIIHFKCVERDIIKIENEKLWKKYENY